MRGFLGGKSLHVAQENHRAQGRRKFQDDAVQNGAEFPLEKREIGQCAGIRRLLRGVVQGDFFRGREDALAALHQAGVAGDPEDPWPDALGVAQLVQVLEDAQQRFLRHFFGIVGVSANQPAIAKYLGAEMLDEAFKCVRFAGEQRTSQIDFFLRRQARL